MSYTSWDLDGVARCPICRREGNRYVFSGHNLTPEEQSEFVSDELVECPVHGVINLNSPFPGWPSRGFGEEKSILEILQQ